MGTTVSNPGGERHRELPEKASGAMAKATIRDIRKAENVDFRELIGHAIERARTLSGLSLKEFAAAVGRDERQVSRWENGGENPQLHAIFARPDLRQVLVIALAELAEGVEVTTHIAIKRTA